MRRAWDGFAADDAMYFIHAGKRDWSTEDFFESGKWFAAQAVEWMGDAVERERILDLGCGLGRLSVHLAREFDRVDAVDISTEMLEQARRLEPPSNVHFQQVSGTDLEPFPADSFDAVCSAIVLQHIPDPAIVERYLAEIARVMRPDGAAVLQVDSRRQSTLRRAVLHLPDRVLRPAHRRHMRRYPKSTGWWHRAVDRAGLSIRDERGPGTDGHLLLLSVS